MRGGESRGGGSSRMPSPLKPLPSGEESDEECLVGSEDDGDAGAGGPRAASPKLGRQSIFYNSSDSDNEEDDANEDDDDNARDDHDDGGAPAGVDDGGEARQGDDAGGPVEQADGWKVTVDEDGRVQAFLDEQAGDDCDRGEYEEYEEAEP